jgi:hypothetical protein
LEKACDNASKQPGYACLVEARRPLRGVPYVGDLSFPVARRSGPDGETGELLMTELLISVILLPAGGDACSVISLAGEADLTTTALREGWQRR